jgi:hypothetical protein
MNPAANCCVLFTERCGATAGGNMDRQDVNPATLTIDSVSRIPGTTRMLAGGFSHAPDGTNVVAVLLQSS